MNIKRQTNGTHKKTTNNDEKFRQIQPKAAVHNIVSDTSAQKVSCTVVIGRYSRGPVATYLEVDIYWLNINQCLMGVRWPSGRASDSGARGPGFEPHERRVASLSKIL